VKSVKIWALDLGHVDTSLKNKSRRSGSILRKWNMPPASDAIAECLQTMIDSPNFATTFATPSCGNCDHVLAILVKMRGRINLDDL
jgi:hypothetical protein